jgi:osmotically-inducible protein OsmY
MKSDRQVRLDVVAELDWEPSLDARSVSVAVRDGIVTLAGYVCSYAQKCNAEHAAQRVVGVKALVTELEVELAASSQHRDQDIAHAAQHVVKWLVSLPPDHVKVMVEAGWITLSGEVDWDYQRHDAVAAVRNLRGVTGISDQISIRANLSSSLVKSDIEAALSRRVEENPHDISVELDGADVTLSGTVHSWEERVLAKHAAWSTPGVRNVVDKLILAW